MKKFFKDNYNFFITLAIITICAVYTTALVILAVYVAVYVGR